MVVCIVKRQLQLLLAWPREASPCLSCTARLQFWLLNVSAAFVVSASVWLIFLLSQAAWLLQSAVCLSVTCCA